MASATGRSRCRPIPSSRFSTTRLRGPGGTDSAATDLLQAVNAGNRYLSHLPVARRQAYGVVLNGVGQEQRLRPVDEGRGAYPPGCQVESQARLAVQRRLEGTPVLTVVQEGSSGEPGRPGSLIDEIVREGARRMLAKALQAEVDAYIAAHAAERGEDGRRLVVRNGHHQPREVLTSAGAVEVTAPRVNDKRTDPVTGERKRFSSAILPPWARKTPKITEVLLCVPRMSSTALSSRVALSAAQP
jgi:Transposase, Mutator family